jgi:hypothetical protein
MNPKSSRLVGQLIVLIPVLALSAFLASQGVAPGPRLALCLGFGLLLIGIVSVWQRRHQ